MRFRHDPFDLLDTPMFLRGCTAEGEGEEGGGGEGEGEGAENKGNGQTDDAWYSSIDNENLRGALSGFDSQEKALEAIGFKTPDWRDGIEDEKARDHAKRFASPTDIAKGNLELKGELDRIKNSAILPPGKDASEDDIAAYHKKIGVPDPDGYKFPDPPNGYELTDLDKAAQGEWGKRLNALSVPKATAEALLAALYDDQAKAEQAIVAEDKSYADESEAILTREWGDDADRNKQIANAAAKQLLGDDFAEMDAMTNKANRLILDNPAMVRMFAKIGREMQEGQLATMSDDAKQTLEGEIGTVRKQIAEAQAAGDSKRANALYEKEQGLVAKVVGDQPIVGSQGRAA